IREFPFFADASAAQIMIPANPSADEEWAAQRVQEYFQFWGKESAQPPREIELPIVRGAQNADVAKPRIVIGGDAKIVRRDGNVLTVVGQSVREATLRLLAALDEKYF